MRLREVIRISTHLYTEVFITPSGTPDKFVSSGTGTLGRIIIHPDERMTTERIEDT
jgi:hypothetical protein